MCKEIINGPNILDGSLKGFVFGLEKEYTIFGSDHFLKPFYYNVSEDGQSYVLKSAGSDKEYNTEDDIFPNI